MSSKGRKRILEALDRHGPMTDDKIAALAFVALSSFQGKYRRLMLDAGEIHIAEYQRNPRGGWPIAVYANGCGKEASKPELIPKSESNARWYARRRPISAIDPTLAALMGMAT